MNIWQFRGFFIEKYNVDSSIINDDQIPLHCNESFQQKTLSFKREDTLVKENYMLFHERVSVFTKVFRQENIKLDPEFVFKGKAPQAKVALADSANYQWPVSESYRLDQMLKTISNLPYRFNPITPKDFAIYVLR